MTGNLLTKTVYSKLPAMIGTMPTHPANDSSPTTKQCGPLIFQALDKLTYKHYHVRYEAYSTLIPPLDASLLPSNDKNS